MGPAELILCGGGDGLLDDGGGIGDAAGPEGVPDAVDFGFDFASDHSMNAFLAHGVLQFS